ncbi:MAG: helix-turn-helix transcriptional regulator, partial [Firmicutes bacterium]|nr:helix-turn-helix transcriptional regulator [Bacillota bacterium]
PIKQKNNDEEVVSPQKGDTAFLFCRNADNMLLPLIHIVVPVRELLEEATVGEKIAFYRFKADLTQEELANLLNISVDSVKRYENNKRCLPLEVANTMAIILNITPNFLYDEYNLFISYPYSKKMRELRINKGYTRKEFANLLGLNIRTIERWENGTKLIQREYFNLIKSYLQF